MARKWTPEMRELLKREYRKTPTKRLAKRLSGMANRRITPKGLREQARKLGVSAAQVRATWSRDDEDYLRQNYMRKRSAYIARKLGKTLGQLKYKAAKMGLTRLQREWSPEEDRFLVSMVTEWSRGRLAAHFGCTELTVNRRLRFLEIDSALRREELTGVEVAELVGVESQTVSKWVAKGLLRAILHEPGAPLKVRPRDLRKFVLANRHLVNLARIGTHAASFIGLIADEWG